MSSPLIVTQSHMEVELVDILADDERVARAAQVSRLADDVPTSDGRLGGLIRALMRRRHGSPFEAGYFSFRITATRGVHLEHVRHRAGWSYSASSLRYVEHAPVVYIPPPQRPLKKAPNFKAMSPQYVALDPETYAAYVAELEAAYEDTYRHYQRIQDLGVDSTEGVRFITDDGLFMSYHARCNPRSLMHFLGLRTYEKEANHPSFPMFEIEQVARQMEVVLENAMPLTYEAWNTYGREAP